MKAAFTLLVCLMHSWILVAGINLTPKAEISVLTCSPGTELYSVFGHSAIRVMDPGRIDQVYNYGTFEFTDDFYIKFARGKLNYRLSRSSFSAFQYEYMMTGRSITEQVLNLTFEQKQELFDYLEWNHLPENRYYLYDFFYDNCATRIRDVLNENLGEVNYNSSFATDSASFRDMIDLYLNDMVWSDFGIDLALGAPCDKKLDAQENMFLPDYVFSELSTARLNGTPLVKRTEVLLPAEPQDDTPLFDWPMLLGGVLALFAFAHLAMYRIRGRAGYLLPRIYLVTYGLLGIFIFALWFLTDHTTTKMNLNIIWAFPFHLIAAFLLKKDRFRQAYFRTFALIYVVFILTGFIWPQRFHPASYELAVAMLAISLRLGFTASGKNE